MTKLAIAVLAAIVVAMPSRVLAASKPTGSSPPPSSYAPRPHSNQHVYGSPIGPPIVGSGRSSHRPRAASNAPNHATAHGAHAARTHRNPAKSPA